MKKYFFIPLLLIVCAVRAADDSSIPGAGQLNLFELQEMEQTDYLSNYERRNWHRKFIEKDVSPKFCPWFIHQHMVKSLIYTKGRKTLFDQDQFFKDLSMILKTEDDNGTMHYLDSYLSLVFQQMEMEKDLSRKIVAIIHSKTAQALISHDNRDEATKHHIRQALELIKNHEDKLFLFKKIKQNAKRAPEASRQAWEEFIDEYIENAQST